MDERFLGGSGGEKYQAHASDAGELARFENVYDWCRLSFWEVGPCLGSTGSPQAGVGQQRCSLAVRFWTRLHGKEVKQMNPRSVFTTTRKRVSDYLLGESGSVNPRSALIGGAILTTSMVGVLLGGVNSAHAIDCPHVHCAVGKEHWCCDSDQVCGAIPPICHPA